MNKLFSIIIRNQRFIINQLIFETPRKTKESSIYKTVSGNQDNEMQPFGGFAGNRSFDGGPPQDGGQFGGFDGFGRGRGRGGRGGWRGRGGPDNFRGQDMGFRGRGGPRGGRGFGGAGVTTDFRLLLSTTYLIHILGNWNNQGQHDNRTSQGFENFDE